MLKKLILLVLFTSTVAYSECSSGAANQEKQPIIMLLNFGTQTWGGIAIHCYNLHKLLNENNIPSMIVVKPESTMATTLTNLKIPYQLTTNFAETIAKLVKRKTPIILVCNKFNDVNQAKTIKASCTKSQQKLIKIAYIQHNPATAKTFTRYKKIFRALDGVICVNPSYVAWLNLANKTQRLGIKTIVSIPPFFDEKKFLNPAPFSTKEDFFEKTFNLKLGDLPIITIVAHLQPCKNHKLLLEAIHELIYKRNRKAHVIFAGSNPHPQHTELLKNLATQLKVEKYVHFIGFTDKTPELLYHSDMHVLPSTIESFGIVNLEAGLMKKPTIGSTKTGAEHIIKHNTTGLIFKNDNLAELTNSIQTLLDNPDRAKSMGENAHAHIKKHFLNTAKMKKLSSFFDQLFS